MCYHVFSRVNEDFMRKFVNTFIIRDQGERLVEHYRLNPEFTLTEAGYESMYTMYEMAKRLSGKAPAIVDGDDLIKDGFTVVKGYCDITGIPFLPEAIGWGAEFKREWKTWEIWHLDAAKSTGFQKDLESFDFTVFDVPRLKEMYEQCMPYYEKLHAVRIKPAA